MYVLCSTGGRHLAETYAERLPGASVEKSCVRFPRLAAVDVDVLEEFVVEAARTGPGDAAGTT